MLFRSSIQQVQRLRRAFAPALIAAALLLPAARPAHAYSVLTHEQLIDLAWQRSIAPLLQARYPGITAAELEQARAYAYGGCVIQDIGYYPFGDVFLSNLTHYVRSGDFVVNLFRDARNADELAFAIGALSHYYGDSTGHSEATNLAVPVEFPRLRARFGQSVSYGEGEHAHVQTEFAFDIDEIVQHRLAPVHYLRRVGLKVPVQQLSDALYQTYGLSSHFTGAHLNHINVRGYRFAVHSFLPRIAYAVTVLHRNSEPLDTSTPELAALQGEVDKVAQENNWAAYRRTAGPGTYLLAGIIWVLPKFGPLKLLSIKGPTPKTENEYIESVNSSISRLTTALSRFGHAHQGLANLDLDTGLPTRPGGYRLTDATYAELLGRITKNPRETIPPGLRADVLHYYADPNAPISTRNNPKAWAAVQRELIVLNTIPVSNEPIAPETE